MRDEAGPRRYALFREVRPTAVEGATVVLGVPAHLPFHLAQLQEDDRLTEIVVAVASELLKGKVSIGYRARDGEEEAAAAETDQEPSKAPDKEDLAEAGEGGIDPTDLVVDLLGGEVVDD